MAKLTPMLAQYFEIKEKHKDTVLFFHLGDFYEMFGNDAVEVSRLLDLTLTARGKGTENEIPMCGIPVHASSQYLSKLTKHGKRVAICDQVSAPDARLPDGQGKGIVKREVTRIITPGTTFDDAVLESKQANFLCAVAREGQQIGLAALDVTTGKFLASECADMDALLHEFARLRPTEILVQGLSDEEVEACKRFAFVNVFAVPSWEKPKTIIEKQFGVLGGEGLGLPEGPVMSAVANALYYVQETQKSSLGHIQGITRQQPDGYVLLDESTIRNLELFASQHTGLEQGSFVQAIDMTVTSMGGRLLREWVSRPLAEAAAIEARLSAVDSFYNDGVLRDTVREHLSSMCDVERLVGKVGTMRVNPRDLYNLRLALELVPVLKGPLKAVRDASPRMKDLYGALDAHEDLVADIAKTVNDDPPVLMQEGGFIRQGVSKELDELRELSSTGKEWISKMQEDERKATGINSLKVKYNSVFGYYIEISKANLASVPQHYIRKQTLVNAERYITPELKEYEEKVLGAQEKIIRIEYELFEELRRRAFAHAAALQQTARTLAELDVLTSFAQLAAARRYSRPAVSSEPLLSITDGRHPVIETMIDKPYVPNSVYMDDDMRFMLLTGPNMSGKSSFLRQTALIVLMAQMGSYVPASRMEWSVVDRIFTRVGASDQMAAGRSTFMVEMQEAAYILNNATENSLIVFDELGRGTSTYDGLSLAWAMTEHVHDVIKAKTLFATHYHELIEIVERLPAAANYSVAVAEQDGRVIFLHHVQEGGINRSYGIDVAKLAGLPHGVLLRAKDILVKLEQHAWEQKQQTKQGTLPLMPVAKQTEHPVVAKLRAIDPNALTPMQALQLLQEYKNEADE